MEIKLATPIFQFEYLNEQKMSNPQMFLDKFASFLDGCPREYSYAVEIRNPNYFSQEYFEFQGSHELHHVFLQGYYMPSIFEVYQKYHLLLNDLVVIRLHGPDRKDIEKKTQNKWNEIVSPKDEEISSVSQMERELNERDIAVYVNVNNHYKGSAPKTIEKILANLYS